MVKERLVSKNTIFSSAGFILVFIIGIISWQIVSFLWPQIVPSPLNTLIFIIANKKYVLGDIWVTLTNTIIGYLIALSLTLFLGVLGLKNRFASEIIKALNTIIQSVSALIWALIFLVIFGFTSRTPAIAVAAATAFPILLANILKGFEYAENEYGEVVRLYKPKRLQSLIYLYMPASLPFIVAASRAAFGAALRISVVAEAFGAMGGIGYRLWLFYELHEYRGLFGWAFILVLLMLLIDKVMLEPIEKWAKKWQT